MNAKKAKRLRREAGKTEEPKHYVRTLKGNVRHNHPASARARYLELKKKKGGNDDAI